MPSKNITRLIEQSVVGAVGKACLPRKNLIAFEIPLPPLAEQQRIVATLDAAFADIDRVVEIENKKGSRFIRKKLSRTSVLNFSSSYEWRLGDAQKARRNSEVYKCIVLDIVVLVYISELTIIYQSWK